MTTHNIDLGQFTVQGLRDGHFALDGGPMFGVVPKTIWEKAFPADELNRIHFGLNSILIKTPSTQILVDTGIGTIIPEKFLQYLGVDQAPGLVQSLKNLGSDPEDIDFVINTDPIDDDCPCPELVFELETELQNNRTSLDYNLILGMLWLYCKLEKSAAYFKKAYELDSQNQTIKSIRALIDARIEKETTDA